MLLLGRYQMRLISLLCHLWLLTWWKMNKAIYRCMLSLWSVWLIRIGNFDTAYAISSLPKIWSMEIFWTQRYNKIISKSRACRQGIRWSICFHIWTLTTVGQRKMRGSSITLQVGFNCSKKKNGRLSGSINSWY